MSLTSHEKMTRARAELVMGHPFFATLALKLRLKHDATCATLWTDGKELGFNPEYVQHMSLENLVGMQAHEVMHLVCQHHIRRNGRDAGLWNKACDYAINSILLQAGFSLPKRYLDNPEYRDMSVDDIYAVLSRLREEEKGSGIGDSAQGGMEEADEGNGGAADGGSPFDHDTDMAHASVDNEPENDGDERTRAAVFDGEGEEGQGEDQDPGMSGEVRDHPGIQGKGDQQALEQATRDMRIDLAQAVQRALNMGDLPQGIERLVNRSLKPQLDWQTVLRRFLQSSTANDYSWTVPNRRYVYLDLHLPSLKSQELPEIVLAIDTSGSVDDMMLDRFCSEISSLLEVFDTRLTVILCDAAIHKVETYTRWDLPVNISPQGGGGTDYRPVFEYLALHGAQPACCIYMTDFECNRFPEAPPYPVLWVNSGNAKALPPFGEVLCMQGDRVCA